MGRTTPQRSRRAPRRRQKLAAVLDTCVHSPVRRADGHHCATRGRCPQHACPNVASGHSQIRRSPCGYPESERVGKVVDVEHSRYGLRFYEENEGAATVVGPRPVSRLTVEIPEMLEAAEGIERQRTMPTRRARSLRRGARRGAERGCSCDARWTKAILIATRCIRK